MTSNAKWIKITSNICIIQCKLCGKTNSAANNFTHIDTDSKKMQIKYLKHRANEAMEMHISRKHKIKNIDGYKKPWKDPESLFCAGDFLTELIGKDISTSDECKKIQATTSNPHTP